MKRFLLGWSFCVMFLIAGCGDTWQEEAVGEPLPPPPPETEPGESAALMKAGLPVAEDAPELQLGDFPLAFAFADLSGERLLIHCDEEGAAYQAEPERYTLALGPYGEIVNISYSHWQDGTEENNYRREANNFDNLPGYAYQAIDGKLLPDQTYALTAAGMLEHALVPLLPPDKPNLDDAAIDRIIEGKSRGIVWAEPLAATADGAQMGLVLWERLGDDMLFSIVYLDDGTTLFWDCPAEYDEYATWRVDLGDQPGLFTPLGLARLENGLALLLTWGAPEGERMLLLYEDEGKFIERVDYIYYRYWAPE